MKFLVILSIFLSLFKISEQQTGNQIFKTDLTTGFNTQFEPFQDTTTSAAQVTIEDLSNVLTFTKLTKYQGLVTKNWITSPNGTYFIVIEFKGQANQQTGAFIGYIREDNQNIYKAIGLDAPYNMDIYQIFRFKSTGQWNTYNAYIRVPKGVGIKIILEQGSYFGIKTLYQAQFKNLAVWDYTFSEDCPGNDDQVKFSYFTFLFDNMELKNKIFVDSYLENEKSKGVLKFQFSSFNTPCIKTVFFGFDSDEQVIESFEPTHQSSYDLYSANVDQLEIYTFTFAMSDLEEFGCKSEFISCMQENSDTNCQKYTCSIAFHFYYDKGMEFNSKQEEYDFTKNNSQTIFNSSFSVILSKQEVVNTYFKTVDAESACTGVCVINTDLKLKVEMKTSESASFTTQTNQINTTWGNYIYFQITSDATDYKFELIKIIITTESETFMLGPSYIEQYITQIESSFGLLKFKMRFSAEAAIEKGKQCSLSFLVEAKKDEQLRFLETYTNLPSAVITSENSFYAKDAVRNVMRIATALILLLVFN